jgi:hypothetical protein
MRENVYGAVAWQCVTVLLLGQSKSVGAYDILGYIIKVSSGTLVLVLELVFNLH